MKKKSWTDYYTIINAAKKYDVEKFISLSNELKKYVEKQKDGIFTYTVKGFSDATQEKFNELESIFEKYGYSFKTTKTKIIGTAPSLPRIVISLFDGGRIEFGFEKGAEYSMTKFKDFEIKISPTKKMTVKAPSGEIYTIQLNYIAETNFDKNNTFKAIEKMLKKEGYIDLIDATANFYIGWNDYIFGELKNDDFDDKGNLKKTISFKISIGKTEKSSYDVQNLIGTKEATVSNKKIEELKERKIISPDYKFPKKTAVIKISWNEYHKAISTIKEKPILEMNENELFHFCSKDDYDYHDKIAELLKELKKIPLEKMKPYQLEYFVDYELGELLFPKLVPILNKFGFKKEKETDESIKLLRQNKYYDLDIIDKVLNFRSVLDKEKYTLNLENKPITEFISYLKKTFI